MGPWPLCPPLAMPVKFRLYTIMYNSLNTAIGSPNPPDDDAKGAITYPKRSSPDLSAS